MNVSAKINLIWFDLDAEVVEMVNMWNFMVCLILLHAVLSPDTARGSNCQQLEIIRRREHIDIECGAILTLTSSGPSRLDCALACHEMGPDCPDLCVAFQATGGTCTMCLQCPTSPQPTNLSGNIHVSITLLTEIGKYDSIYIYLRNSLQSRWAVYCEPENVGKYRTGDVYSQISLEV